MDTATSTTSDYIMGHSQRELERLIAQARFYEPLTAPLLRLAGIQSGMRVLDLGSGAGDTAFLEAQIVGPTGCVIGIDKSAQALATASARAMQQGLTNVSFVQADIHDYKPDTLFDAAVGRLVLMYQPNPLETVRQISRCVRPDGVVIFQDLDFSVGTLMQPESLLHVKCVHWVTETLARAGVCTRMGLSFYDTLTQAGLLGTQVIASAHVGGGPDTPMYEYITEAVRALLPAMIQFGIATADEVQIQTLTGRLRDERVRLGGCAMLPPLMGAWARTPQQ